MTQFFTSKVDRRNRSAMVEFLKGHQRYYTMRPNNGLTSYSNNIKINSIGLNSQEIDRAFDILDTDYWQEIREPIDQFSEDQGYRYTICCNGRSDGYLVLHECRLELTGHLSYCPTCGQNSYKKVPVAFQNNNEEVIAKEILRSQNSWFPHIYLTPPEIKELPISQEEKLFIINRLKYELIDCSLTDVCGFSNNPRLNYITPPLKSCVSNISIDHHEEFYRNNWTLEALRERVELISSFDAACDAVRCNFIELIRNYDVVEFTEHRPVKVKRLVARTA